MTTKMKGLFKGLRYISHKIDEDEQKEEEIQIGLPTDVKHVSHIGWEGPATSVAADTPTWMKNLNPSTSTDSKPNKDDAETTKRSQRTKKSHEEGAPKTSRRRSTDNNNATDTSPKKPSRRQSTDSKNSGDGKPRQSRRNQAKDSSEGGSDVPKRTHRKKAESNEGGLRRARNRDGGDAATVQKPSSAAGEDDAEREGRVN